MEQGISVFDAAAPFHFIEYLQRIFTSDFMPHGHCYFWRPEILWLNVVGDALIFLSYFASLNFREIKNIIDKR